MAIPNYPPHPNETAGANPFAALTREQKLNAIRERISVRAYLPRRVEDEKISALRAYIDYANKAQGTVAMELCGPFDDAGELCGIASAMFTGTFHWFAALSYELCPAAEEAAGWLGEELILLATQLGLGTCWVAGTYDKGKTAQAIDPAKPLQIIVPIGYEKKPTPLKQRTIRTAVRSRIKGAESLAKTDCAYRKAPVWFREAMDAVAAAPSAVCQQPVTFTLHEGALSADFGEKTDRRQAVDFGIAKLHFRIGAGDCGEWQAGRGGVYTR